MKVFDNFMPRKILTGTRIRDVRIEIRQKQAELAAVVGISPAYLNLIEHNKRRIGGKLLNNIAHALGVDVTSLAEGAEEQVVTQLRGVAMLAGRKISTSELNKIEDLARRFPNWSDLLIAQSEKITRLTDLTAEMSDRLAHNPFLAESLHDAISTVTAIRSTASILMETDSIDVAIQKRFTDNLTQDSERLSESLEGLVRYFDGLVTSNQKNSEQVFDQLVGGHDRDKHYPDLNGISDVDFENAAENLACDPFELSKKFDLSFSKTLLKIASLTPIGKIPVSGLVVCDGAGAFRFQKPIEGFPVPLSGGACALWPVFQALLQPQVPIRKVVEMPGLRDVKFLTYAIAEIAPRLNSEAPLVVEATMLILPETHIKLTEQTAMQVGISCRICPRMGCQARRAEAVLA